VSAFYELGDPDRVTVGTVGVPGQRIFYLQARQATTLITLKLEKQQIAALAIHLGQLLEDLPRPGELPEESSLELEEFAEAAFVVGTLAVAYDATSDRVVVLAEERLTEDEPADGDEARLALTREQAGALAIRGTRLVESGRPPCPLCGFPLDTRGHACPRTNGHHAPLT
jgi:uncharacterized repeat protein (TIGR03847 family)